jgi:outer membrane biosynthesis protein TonB
MTAVMRAVAPTGPKVLRIGVVQNGRVVEERIIKKRQTVTVGSSENNAFVIAAKDLPASFALFELVGEDYHLNFREGMNGRVALPTGISELSVLQGQARRTGDGYQIKLTEDARGKVIVGENSFLFQFVSPPPVQPRPQLPVSVIRGATGVDWPTTMIAAFSFLAHFLALGALYSDWLDPVVDYEVNVQSLVETVRNLPAPPPVEEKATEENPKEAEKAEEKEAKPEPKQAAKPDKAADPGDAKPRMNAREVAALSNELDSFDMGILGANTGKAATADVLSSGDNVATSIMDKAAASGAGVSAGGPGGLKLNGGGGAINPGEGTSLASIGNAGKSEGTGTSGAVATVKGPTGNASVGGASVAGGTVGNAASVVAGMRAGFRACYNRGLATNPDASGKIDLKLRIGPGGEVTGVAAASSGNLPGSVVDCVKGRARSGRFSPPDSGSAVISVPVSFVKQ